MLMSIGFSVVFHNASSHQLGRQIPPTSFYTGINTDGPLPSQVGPQTQIRRTTDFDEFFQRRVSEGRHELLVRLVWLNALALVAGAIFSYALARKTLEPIEAAMESQKRFISDASHELRTPITALQTTNEVALRKQRLKPEEARDLILHNVAEAAKLKELSDSLLSLLRQDSPKLTYRSISLQDVARDAINQIVATALKKNITVEDSVPNIKTRGDSASLTRAVTILLDNAIKYSHAKSRVEISGYAKGSHAYIFVKDEGTGIHATDIPHIFDRFYRADRSRSKDQREGYGLGLSIAHKIIEQHTGAITVESQPGKGSTFTIKLPLAAS